MCIGRAKDGCRGCRRSASNLPVVFAETDAADADLGVLGNRFGDMVIVFSTASLRPWPPEFRNRLVAVGRERLVPR